MKTNVQAPVRIGTARVDRIQELQFPEGPPSHQLTDLPEEAVDENLSWFAPDYYEEELGFMISSVHTWVVRQGDLTVLIDTGIGNDKSRPQFPPIDGMQTPFLDRLAEIGVTPEDVDIVICTHLHFDHIGWNTQLRDGVWVPTFPRATYYLSSLDYDHWHPETGDGREDPINLNAFGDSIAPVAESGRVSWVDGPVQVTEDISIEPAPGHSPGHSVVRLSSEGETAIFFGDLLHSPLQVRYPQSNSPFCQDQPAAAQSRRRVLDEAAAEGHTLFSTHFPAPSAGRVEVDGDRFTWVPLVED
jgi:glyoxylase-like metal-dependent hydrolase (beta-lactamase superfamily II)